MVLVSAIRAPVHLIWGDADGPVNNLCVHTAVAAEYAPPGRTLISASVLGEPDETSVRRQLHGWFGPAVEAWRLLRVDRIEQALPAFPPGEPLARPRRVEPGLYACGDRREHPSLDGALRSGRLAAEAVAADLA